MANQGIGKRLAPPRFLLFMAIIIVGTPLSMMWLDWSRGAMLAFDVAAIVFFITVFPLLDDETQQMRQSARANDANRVLLLVITGVVMTVVLASVAAELGQKGRPKPLDIALIVVTLTLSWLFSNLIYALHYAHRFYDDEKGEDAGGLHFPETPEPDYWDFIYFSTCLGMTFQTSDVEIRDARIRHIVTFHSLAAFVFNLGVIAFTINVLGGS